MFENLTEIEARQKIVELAGEYCEKYHVRNREFKTGDRISYAGRVYDKEEMMNLVDSSLEFWLTSGRYTDKFESDLAAYLNIKHCSLVNSGSSANLLAFMALTSPLLGERAILRGDEVITVAACFPTTVAPIIQYGAIPVFVDISIPQYNIDISQLEKALSDKTKAVMIAHTLGNPFNLKKVKEFCIKNKLWLVEDNCDALGSKYRYNEEDLYTGTIGDIGTSSFYPPHHITMGEGGAVYTNNDLLHKIIRSFRDWGRDCVCPSGKDNVCKHRFEHQYGSLPLGYDHKYVYSHMGYNLKATDMQAAIGFAQIKKLTGFVEARRRNWQYLRKGMEGLSHLLILPEKEPDSNPSWFGFMLCVRSEENKTRGQIVQYLEKHNIQTRNLFAGNILRHPCFEQLSEGKDYKVVGNLDNTDYVMNNGFWIGNYSGMQAGMLDEMIELIYEVLR